MIEKKFDFKANTEKFLHREEGQISNSGEGVSKFFGQETLFFKKGSSQHAQIARVIEIEEEFKRLIPPLADEEYEILKSDISRHGCKEAISLWHNKAQNRYIIIDGHNRYQICQELGKNFDIRVFDLVDAGQVVETMFSMQLGRRNLSREGLTYLRGSYYLRLKSGQGGNTSARQNVADYLSELFKVSEKTIRNDGAYVEGIHYLIDNFDKDIWQKIISGQSKQFTKSEIEFLGKNKDRIKDPMEFLATFGVKSAPKEPKSNTSDYSPEFLFVKRIETDNAKAIERIKHLLDKHEVDKAKTLYQEWNTKISTLEDYLGQLKKEKEVIGKNFNL